MGAMVSPMTAEEALAKLAPEERASVERFREEVRARYGARVRDIRIFGSKVRGDHHDESDIDLLVLIEDCDDYTRREVGELAYSFSSWLSAIVEDFERYHAPISRASPFYKELRKESVKL